MINLAFTLGMAMVGIGVVVGVAVVVGVGIGVLALIVGTAFAKVYAVLREWYND